MGRGCADAQAERKGCYSAGLPPGIIKQILWPLSSILGSLVSTGPVGVCVLWAWRARVERGGTRGRVCEGRLSKQASRVTYVSVTSSSTKSVECTHIPQVKDGMAWPGEFVDDKLVFAARDGTYSQNHQILQEFQQILDHQ